MSYIRNSFEELKKVTWPTNSLLYKGSVLIMFIVIFFTVLVGASDILIGKVMFVLNKQFGG